MGEKLHNLKTQVNMKHLLITLIVLVLSSTNASPQRVESVSVLPGLEGLAYIQTPRDKIEKQLRKEKDDRLVTFLNYSMPVEWRQVYSHFGYRPRFKRNHYGVDLKACIGDTVVAAFSGVVRSVKFERGGYGFHIVIEHDYGVRTLYAHLSRFLVKEGDIVRNGEPIALSGNSGRSTGPHLHFEIIVQGKKINPEIMFDFEKGCLTDTKKWIGIVMRES